MGHYSKSMLQRHFISNLLRPVIALTPVKFGVVALTFHNILPEQFSWFERLVKLVIENYEVIDPKEFLANRISTQAKSLQVLFTFDDGFYSNRLLVEKVLANHNVKALFFLPEGFIGLNENDAYNFVIKKIYPTRKTLKGVRDQYRALSWKDVEWLITQGHVVGGHSKQHLRLSTLSVQKQVEEIVDSANRIEARLGIKISSFAYPFGSVSSINSDSIRFASQRFQYSFSNVRGTICESPSQNFLFRQNLVAGDPLWLVQAMIEGRIDWKYHQDRRAAIHLLLEAGV